MGLSVGLVMKLTDLKARNIKPNDRPIADGTVPGLRLHPGKKKGQGKWLLRFVSPETNARREMGFGVFTEVSISDARRAASAARDLIRDGKDPIEARKADTQARHRNAHALTFEKAARQVHADLKPGWKNSRHTDSWISSLEMYVFPRIGNRKIKDLEASDFADALRSIWIDKAETASRVRQRCSAVMDLCVAKKHIRANPLGVV